MTGDGGSVVVLFFTHLSSESCLGVVETVETVVEYLGVFELGSVIREREGEEAPSPKYHQISPNIPKIPKIAQNTIQSGQKHH